MNEILSETLADAATFLERHDMPFALIGGYAASLRGQPRLTADVDLAIATDIDRAMTLIPALSNSPFEPLFPGVEEVVQRAFILPLRHRTTRIKVDIAIGLSRFEQQVVARAHPMLIAGKSIAVAMAEDLLLMKVIAGRPRDDQDIDGLLSAHGRRLDWTYCETTARSLGQALDQDLLTRVQALHQSTRIDDE